MSICVSSTSRAARSCDSRARRSGGQLGAPAQGVCALVEVGERAWACVRGVGVATAASSHLPNQRSTVPEIVQRRLVLLAPRVAPITLVERDRRLVPLSETRRLDEWTLTFPLEEERDPFDDPRKQPAGAHAQGESEDSVRERALASAAVHAHSGEAGPHTGRLRRGRGRMRRRGWRGARRARVARCASRATGRAAPRRAARRRAPPSSARADEKSLTTYTDILCVTYLVKI